MATQTEPVAPVPAGERRGRGQVITSFVCFLIAGAPAMAIRAELARGKRDVVEADGHKGGRP